MLDLQRDNIHYTAFFCEENIWLLAHALRDRGFHDTALSVLFFSNPWSSVLLRKQRNVPDGLPTVWDYHVVLEAEHADGRWIFDPDSRLPFPCPYADYLHDTFGAQDELRHELRTWVRRIPASAYLDRFHSDRSHMLGMLPPEAFPNYPPIQVAADTPGIALHEYRDMRRELDDGSVVLPVSALITGEHAEPRNGRG